jgi:hypothetical protein
MKIILTWQDLLKLAGSGSLEKGENTLTISREIEAHTTVSGDGKGSVQFKVGKLKV